MSKAKYEAKYSIADHRKGDADQKVILEPGSN